MVIPVKDIHDRWIYLCTKYFKGNPNSTIWHYLDFLQDYKDPTTSLKALDLTDLTAHHNKVKNFAGPIDQILVNNVCWHEFLYDDNHPHYHNSAKRSEAFKEMAKMVFSECNIKISGKL